MKFIKKYYQEITLAAILLFAYMPTFIWMWDRWFSRDSYYSHGILIPFISAFIIWQKKDELSKIRRKRSRWGMTLIIIGFLIQLLSSLFRVYFSSGLSLLVILFGLVLHFWGTKVLRKILFPLGFLFFMIPMPLVIVVNVSFRMKLFAAELATMLLNSMGLSATRQGSIIWMQHVHVVVDDVCSGLRSLISLTALGCLFAYWLKGNMVKRIFLFLMTIPIAILTNVCRVMALSIISEVWGPPADFVHDLAGYLIFALAFAMLYAVSRLLE